MLGGAAFLTINKREKCTPALGGYCSRFVVLARFSPHKRIKTNVQANYKESEEKPPDG